MCPKYLQSQNYSIYSELIVKGRNGESSLPFAQKVLYLTSILQSNPFLTESFLHATTMNGTLCCLSD